MLKRQTALQISLLVLVLIIGMVIISGRGCPKRSRNKIKTGSSNEWIGIAAPSKLTAIAFPFPFTRIDLTWSDNSNNEAGFEIWRSLDGTNWGTDPIATTIADMISYSDTVPPSLATYFYMVRAYNTIGDRSAWSNVAEAITVRSEWQSIAAGESHSLALNTNGTLWGWGDNQYGQLDPSTTASPFTLPALLNTDTDWLAIAAGYYHTLVIKTPAGGGTLWTWGNNDSGQLGLGNTDSPYSPTPVGTDSDWSIALGGEFYTLAIKTNQTIWSCGDNTFGQLGLDNSVITPSVLTLTQIGTNSDWLSITSGGRHTIALKTNRTLWAWGWNYWGQLGEGTTMNRTTPRSIGTNSDWLVVSAGYTHTIALKTTGTLWQWGNNTTPTQIGTDTDWLVITEGEADPDSYYSLALKSNGTLWSWGQNDYGQLGLGDNLNRTDPTQIGIDSNWVAVVAGGYHSIGRTADGTLWVWGRNNLAQLGLGITRNTNIPINLNLPQPTNLIATVSTYTQITLSWSDNSSNEMGFIIERSISPTTGYSILATVGADTISYPDETVTRGNTYYYRVKASYPAGDSAYSNMAVGVTILWDNKIKSILAKFAHSMVWDGTRVIMFGGYGDAYKNDFKNDLSWYDPVTNTWIQQYTNVTPSARAYHSMVWDGTRVIMFGGKDASGNKNDLWWYEPGSNTWTQKIVQDAVGSPSARWGQSMVWDGTRVIMFGGQGVAFFNRNDLWWYYPVTNTWEGPITTGGNGLPSARYSHSMVWDGTRVIMFGGKDASGYKNDLWWYDPALNTWTGPMVISGSPSVRAYHSMVWDGQRVIMFGGYAFDYYSDLWWYDPASNTWEAKILQGAVGSPSARFSHSMVWDGTRVIMFGGDDGVRKNDLWWYDPASGTNGAWIDKTTMAISPTARYRHSMIWDGQKVIMFGGAYYDSDLDTDIFLNDLWWYDPVSNTWTRKKTGFADGSPSARYSHSMVWDGTRVIMFGGNDKDYKNDLWWYDPGSNTWTQKIAQGAVGSPSARWGQSMVWDGQRVIMFGGNGSSGYKNDLWWYDPASNTWEAKILQGAVGSPSARYSHSMVWDTVGQRVIMFGGSDVYGNNKSDLWWYDPALNTWTGPMVISGSPSARWGQSMVWDTVGQRVIMFGGYDGKRDNDLWWW